MNNKLNYRQDTPEEIVKILEAIKGNGVRYRFHWGDTWTGTDWMDEYDVEGYVGQSCGSKPIPILVHNKRSLGGQAILTNSIVKITTTGKNKQTIYKHPDYNCPEHTIEVDPEAKELPFSVCREGYSVARFKTRKEAETFISKWA